MKDLNEREIMTLAEAWKRIKNNNPNKIHLPASFGECKKNLPNLISEKLINTDHLKFAGMIVLTDKGKERAKLIPFIEDTVND